jgi:hypothetical protein
MAPRFESEFFINYACEAGGPFETWEGSHSGFNEGSTEEVGAAGKKKLEIDEPCKGGEN